MTYTSAHLGMSPTTPIRLIDLFRFWKGLPHQNAALLELEQRLLKADPTAFNRDQAWYNTWSSAVEAPASFDNDWNGIMAAAAVAGAKFPEVVAAQWALESGWGKHVPGKHSHNYFGLKGSGTSTTTREFLDGQWVTITDSFIDFPSLAACVEYLVSRWYKDYQQHKGVNRADDRNECARLLVSEGYATDPAYATKLIAIMDSQLGSEGLILDVPYEYQLDNASGTGYRECFSSSCAMIARYHGQVDSDDEYNIIRARYGDTTNPQAQVKALRSLGFDARFRTDCSIATLEAEINAGRPVAVGWLHHGPITAPRGGGHWTCVIGYTEDTIVHNDPNGEADMVNGGYVGNSASLGAHIEYSRKNWQRRWEVDGANTGWAIIVKPEF
jgi:hypothetical protein